MSSVTTFSCFINGTPLYAWGLDEEACCRQGQTHESDSYRQTWIGILCEPDFIPVPRLLSLRVFRTVSLTEEDERLGSTDLPAE